MSAGNRISRGDIPFIGEKVGRWYQKPLSVAMGGSGLGPLAEDATEFW
jgi:hypothetical protein